MTVRTTLVAATAVLLSAALAAPALAATSTGADRPTDRHAATRRAVEAAVADGVPGVTLTARDAHGTWSTTAGVGDMTTGAPRSPEDHYRVASVTKTFVATVLLQLEAEGRLSLDDTVEEWLPGVVRGNGHDGRRITLRHLLNHTSGIYNYTRDPAFRRTYLEGFLEHRYDTVPPERQIAVAMTHAPDFAPGTDWNYSNTNYTLAALVVEKATGRSYGDEIRRRVVAPLGLRSTSLPGTRPTLPAPSSRAYGKLSEDTTSPTYDVTEFNPSLTYGSGEMISTSSDLNRFFTALVRGRLLPPRQLKEMKTTVKIETDGGPNTSYGLGLIRRRLSCGVQVWGHSGDIFGSSTQSVTTADGRHSLTFNFNADWTGNSEAVIEAEFCGR
ncbi:serine hydrolase domain-containing protein [Streptomyces sp. NPDC048751]|uniref:serine hydrolase domain-containing protein n=1 Tax=Streptomyces sp. NPDC048751 TaxID=3365591 RepID=UPI0037137CDC